MNRLFTCFLLFTLFIFVNLSLIQPTLSQVEIDYTSDIADDIETNYLMGYGFNNPGPYIAHGKIWVFYSDGYNAILRTKQAEEGGSWSEENVLFSLTENQRFSMVFDGAYFHFVYNNNLNNNALKYMRSKPESDGSMTMDPAVVIYEDDTWKNHLTYAIEVDHLNRPWILATVVSDGESKPIALSSIDNNGGWVDRPGWPKELQGPSTTDFHGRGNGVVEIENGRILFAWRDEINARMSARLWTADETDADSEGTLGEIENTMLIFRDATRTSLISPAEGIAMLNSTNNVTTRSSTGTWNNVTPDTDRVATRYWNSLSSVDGVVRIWDYNSGRIRYQETDDFGNTWGPVVEKWNAPNVVQVNASNMQKSQGNHNSVLWATGSGSFEPPFRLYMGIEGEIPSPPTPMLVSPPDNEMDVSVDVTLSWNESIYATSYNVQVSQNADFSTNIIDDNIDDTELALSNLDINTEHFWRIRAINEFGESDWSEVWSFTTTGIPPATMLVSPEDDATDISTSPTLSWEPIANVDNYHLQISTTSDFSTLFLNNDSITEAEYEVDGLDHDRRYYWRVRASNEFGDGDWSDVWSFTTEIEVPLAPVLTTPADEATDQPVEITFEWEETDLADDYRLQVSLVSNFSSTVRNIGNISDTTYEVTGLDHSTTYYWRINARNESGTSAWSSVRSFTTIIEQPDIPVLVSPSDGEDDVLTKPLLEWETADRAETYSIQLAEDADFNEMIVEVTDSDSTTLLISDELAEFETFYWRVNATNIGGTSDWSDIWEFTTGEALPVPPALVSPEDGSTNVELDKTLLWNSVPRATSYRIQVSKHSDFSETVYDQGDILNTFFIITDLEGDTEYFWRVRGISDRGEGNWSEVWSFITDDVTSVRELAGNIPDKFGLEQNYPNPFNPATVIRFGLPESATVRLEVYNMLGQRVATLIDGEHYTAGTYEAVWDARDEMGREMSSGMYIYRISAGEYVNVKKMLFTK